MEHRLQFFSEEINFQLDKEDSVRDWILFVIEESDRNVESINYVFCSDDYLLELNKTHLKHDYYTDILTFPYHPTDDATLLADIYISIDRVRDNAQQLGNSTEDELHRVMIHGILHLLGQDDHGTEAQKIMREKENMALAKRNFL